MPSIFSRIVDREIPAHIVWEDDDHLAFLDIDPVQPGHTLVIPKRQVDYLFDLDTDALAGLWRAVATVERGLKAATGCARVCVIVAGFEVPHAHVHLIPTDDLADLPFPPRMSQTAEEFVAMSGRITAALDEH